MNILMIIITIITIIWLDLAFILSFHLIFTNSLFTPRQAVFAYGVLPFMIGCMWYWS